MLLQLGIYIIFEVRVRFNAMDVIDNRGIIIMDLISCSRAQFENNATSGSYEWGNNGCVFKSDEIASYAEWVSS